MLLTDPAIQYWSCVVAVLATLAVLMLWNRVRGPRAVRLLSRAGLLLGGYLATAVAVLVSVNIAYGGLVVSVSDLFADINPPMGAHHHHACAPAPGAPAASAAPAGAVGAAAAAPADPWSRPCPQSSPESNPQSSPQSTSVGALAETGVRP